MESIKEVSLIGYGLTVLQLIVLFLAEVPKNVIGYGRNHYLIIGHAPRRGLAR